MEITIDKALSDLELLLHGWNYQVFLKIHRTPFVPDATPEEYIRATLGKRRAIGAIRDVTAEGLSEKVRESLTYRGDRGHGPQPEAVGSPRFDELMGVVLLYVAAKCQQSTKVVEFREIPEPGIFWYFAYLFVAPEGAEILEGASED